jgi:hypothetical protein
MPYRVMPVSALFRATCGSRQHAARGVSVCRRGVGSAYGVDAFALPRSLLMRFNTQETTVLLSIINPKVSSVFGFMT